MGIAFGEFCFILFVLYLITQIFIPMLFPKQFDKNWLFKKRKPVQQTISEIKVKQENLDNKVKDVVTEVNNARSELDAAYEDLKKYTKTPPKSDENSGDANEYNVDPDK